MIKLKEFLDINWDDVLDPSNKSVEEMWKTFKAVVREGMDDYIPRCTGHVANRKKNFQPCNNELQQMIRRKYKLWNSWIRTKRNAVLQEYKIIRNKVKYITVSLLKHEQEKISVECKSNPKKFWNYINKNTY